MPDWSYQTVFRPILFRLPPKRGRDLALACMGRLSRLPIGPAIIDFMGHMRPDRRLAHTIKGVTFATRMGLGACVDPQLQAVRAFARFGIGFLEIGPISLQPTAGGDIQRNLADESLLFASPWESPGLESVVASLNAVPRVPVFIRLTGNPDMRQVERDSGQIIERLGQRATGYVLPSDWCQSAEQTAVWRRVIELARSQGIQLILQEIPLSPPQSETTTFPTDCSRLLDGVFIDPRREPGQQAVHVEKCDSDQLDACVSRWRQLLGPDAAIVLASGVHEPIQAKRLVDAGVDLIGVDGGLIHSGPGLVKRCNELILYTQLQETATEVPAPRLSWFWTSLMAAGMLVGGVLALIIAATRVVMPYDEMMSGLTRTEIMAINERLLHFMSHDRVTLAGTMLAVGILYWNLSLYGIRRGMHWAQMTVIYSAFSGFASFFLFLGFGYFDPFHAFVTAILFQMLIMALHCDLPPYWNPIEPERTNDAAWRRSQWGQLLFVIHGAILVVAGSVIASVGITSVFVHEDLEFMQTTAEHLFGAHPQLVPLVAHDRATFGGMLLAIGVCVLQSALWGFRRGHAWLWWALMLAGGVAYISTIAIHWQVGYTSLKHLIPAYGGLALLILGGALSRAHLCGENPVTTT